MIEAMKQGAADTGLQTRACGCRWFVAARYSSCANWSRGWLGARVLATDPTGKHTAGSRNCSQEIRKNNQRGVGKEMQQAKKHAVTVAGCSCLMF